MKTAKRQSAPNLPTPRQVFKLYVFSRSVHTFGETLATHLDGEECEGGDEETKKLIKDKFVKGFAKLAEGFARFLQVGFVEGMSAVSYVALFGSGRGWFR